VRDMAEKIKILLMIAFIFLTTVPVALAMVKLDVPTWALFAGHTGIFAAGLYCSLLGRG